MNVAGDLLKYLQTRGDDRLAGFIDLPGRTEHLAGWPQWVPAPVRDAFAADGVRTPWSHQVQAADALHSGQHTMLATGTGSGKSLAAWSPILSDLTELGQRETARISEVGRRASAIYLSPTKALAADQFTSLQKLINATDPPLPVVAAVADGDTPSELKRWARANADVIVTNPDYLHHAMLPSHKLWVRILRALRYVIVDEVHSYRGVAGAHMALVVRRLLRVARFYGANPTVIALSATVSQPADLLGRFLGIDSFEVCAITEDGSPAAAKHLALWRPAQISGLGLANASAEPGWQDGGAYSGVYNGISAEVSTEGDGFLSLGRAEPDADPWATGTTNGGIVDDRAGNEHEDITNLSGTDDSESVLAAHLQSQRRAVSSEAAYLTADFLKIGARVLTFARSRYGAEQIKQIAQRALEGTHVPPSVIAAYRGGYLPEERRELEAALRDGRLRALATTNALELGIDVSGLDATVTAGWPGTRASLWQQAGRAGRGGTEGVSVFVASENPLDNYLLEHPQSLTDPAEPSVFDTANPFVLGPHLCAAAAEVPLTEMDFLTFELPDSQVVEQLVEVGLLSRRPSGWFWNATLPYKAHELANLRGMGTQVQVMDMRDGSVIGSVDAASAQGLVHPGAIYIHQSRTFEVKELREEAALVVPYCGDLRTRPTEHVTVQIVEDQERWTEPGGLFTCHFGTVDVITTITDYDVLRIPGMYFVANHPLSLPPRTLRTKATWWTIDPLVFEQLSIEGCYVPGTLHAAEHASIAILPLLATCDRWDLGGLSAQYHEQTQMPTIFVHDAVTGGAGFARRGFERVREWLGMTMQVVRNCGCDAGADAMGSNGCSACVQSPKCGNGNEPLDRAGAARLLQYLLTQAPLPPDSASKS